jgi:hypothetical protein
LGRGAGLLSGVLGEYFINEKLLFQVALLIADRAKLIEEIDVLRKLKFSEVNGMNKEGELLSEVIKVISIKMMLLL